MGRELQFDFISGQYEAARGMGLAEGGRDASLWRFDADYWFDRLPVGHEFTGDDLRNAVGVVAVGANKNNATGAWFSRMSKARRIRWTGRYNKSVVVSRHANQNRIWQKVK